MHGATDNVIPIRETELLVEELRQAGNKDVQFTRYDACTAPNASPRMIGHNCWDKGYRQKDMWEWLFSKKLSPSTSDVPV